MVQVIIGKKGSGKTKMLIEMVNKAAAETKGNVVCIEQDMILTYDIASSVRLVEAASYKIQGYDALYGFIAGIMARDYDATEIFLDGIKKIGGTDKEQMAAFLEKADALTTANDLTLVVTVSYDEEEVPEGIKKYIVNRH